MKTLIVSLMIAFGFALVAPMNASACGNHVKSGDKDKVENVSHETASEKQEAATESSAKKSCCSKSASEKACKKSAAAGKECCKKAASQATADAEDE